ncbi:MAG: ethanolamine utilization protein EutG [Clostridiales bacterium]|jgi:NitT/TauT family transport system substrate-binding protein|nr:ethanolamine utilization protein EutG [Clostridiales bacterium]
MRKVLSLLVALTMVASLLIGCGDNKNTNDKTETNTKTETNATTETAVKEVTLNIAYMPNFASLVTVVAGMEKGYFEEQGIKIKLVEFADGPTIIAAMESGSIDIGYIGPGAHKLAIQGKADVFAFSHFGNADEIIGNTEKGVNTIQDLKGKTIAMASGTTSETILDLTLAKAGLTRSDITIMDMDASAIVTAMISGSVDAASTWSPNTFAIKKEMGDKALTLTNNMTFVNEVPSIASWICNPSYTEKNSDVLLRFTKALYKAMDYRTDNIEEVAGWVAKEVALDADSVLNQIGDGNWGTSKELLESIADGSLEKAYKAQQDNFIASGAVTEEAAVSDYVLFQNMLDAGK